MGLADRFSRALQATVLVALAVAVIVGILAMHFVASPASHSAPAMQATHSAVSAESHPSTAVVMTDCAGCTEDMTMVMMWCILALLTAALLLLAPWRARRWHRQLLLLHSSASTGIQRVLFFLRPPSLIVLCISRT